MSQVFQDNFCYCQALLRTGEIGDEHIGQKMKVIGQKMQVIDTKKYKSSTKICELSTKKMLVIYQNKNANHRAKKITTKRPPQIDKKKKNK